jgi:hypothetical protein
VSKWTKLRDIARLGAGLFGGVKIKGVKIETIAEEAEKDGAIIADSVHAVKDAAKPRVHGSTGE